MRVKLTEFLRPTFPVVILTIVLFLLSLIVFVTSEGTSKVSWNQYRGAPLKAMVTLRYTGPCGDVVPCTRVTIDEINPATLFADTVFWYMLSAFSIYGLMTIKPRMKRNKKVVTPKM